MSSRHGRRPSPPRTSTKTHGRRPSPPPVSTKIHGRKPPPPPRQPSRKSGCPLELVALPVLIPLLLLRAAWRRVRR